MQKVALYTHVRRALLEGEREGERDRERERGGRER